MKRAFTLLKQITPFLLGIALTIGPAVQAYHCNTFAQAEAMLLQWQQMKASQLVAHKGHQQHQGMQQHIGHQQEQNHSQHQDHQQHQPSHHDSSQHKVQDRVQGMEQHKNHSPAKDHSQHENQMSSNHCSYCIAVHSFALADSPSGIEFALQYTAQSYLFQLALTKETNLSPSSRGPPSFS